MGKFVFSLWFTTWLVLSAGFVLFAMFSGAEAMGFAFLAAFVAFVGSLPALALLALLLSIADKVRIAPGEKIFVILLCLFIVCLCYGSFAGVIDGSQFDESFSFAAVCTIVLFACSVVSFLFHYKAIRVAVYGYQLVPAIEYDEPEPAIANDILLIAEDQSTNQSLTSNTNKQMENNFETNQTYVPQPEPKSNKVVFKAAITGILILIMLIPTLFIINLVEEREQRQKEVVAEVSDKWAKPQTISTPYIVVPYSVAYENNNKEYIKTNKSIVLLPESLQVTGELNPEERKRSIFTVLLYQTELQTSGYFNIKIPSGINEQNLVWADAKLCIGVTDFKGINNQVTATFENNTYELTPGLPTSVIDKDGLSTPISISAADVGKKLSFQLGLNINGSQQLQFLPLAGNSNFSLKSKWANPSFDGATLPYPRQVSDSGFTAQWSFNKAKLPYGTFLNDFHIEKSAFAFGVSMVQPADQYAKTMRSVKYAILFIGLTFSLFFIVELMQKRPVHPVQYVLVGLALVIFYTLLLSISEFVLFDTAYLIASAATVLLITLYAKGHFQSWKVAGVFAGVLGMLYSFIFVLIRLEDTSLLVGSIGLFIVLALVMYASRKINWYNPSFGKEVEIA